MRDLLRRVVPSAVKQRARALTGAGDALPTVELLRRAGAPIGAGAIEHRLAANRHGLYWVPEASSHRPACAAILAGEVWEPDTVALVTATERRGDIVSAGTFFGDLLPAFARSRRRGARVWAFEPSAENHRCAAMTVRLNGLDQVTLTHAGLGAEAGVVDLVTADADGTPLGGGSHVAAAGSAAAAEQTRIVTIDGTVPAERRVAVIQLDVEGFEEQALTGAIDTIRRCRPLLVLENVPSAAWFAEHLAPLGYRDDGKVHENTVYRTASSRPAPG